MNINQLIEQRAKRYAVGEILSIWEGNDEQPLDWACLYDFLMEVEDPEDALELAEEQYSLESLVVCEPYEYKPMDKILLLVSVTKDYYVSETKTLLASIFEDCIKGNISSLAVKELERVLSPALNK